MNTDVVLHYANKLVSESVSVPIRIAVHDAERIAKLHPEYEARIDRQLSKIISDRAWNEEWRTWLTHMLTTDVIHLDIHELPTSASPVGMWDALVKESGAIGHRGVAAFAVLYLVACAEAARKFSIIELP